MGIYERLIHLVTGNALKSASSIYSFLARIQYGKETVQTTTKLCPCGVSMKVVTHFPFNFGYGNIEW